MTTGLLPIKNRVACLYAGALLVATACLFAQWPIFAGDSDLWYHLNGGRYFFEKGSPPRDSYFSFIDPSREWVDYFWLFQVIIYKIFTFFDYYGLVFYRVIIFTLVTSLIFSYLFLEEREQEGTLFGGFIFTMVSLLLMTRYHLIRPHGFSYLFIVLFIYILEYRRKYAPLLPLFALLWVNIHGIEYPVMLLIVLSYLFEFFFNHIKNKSSLTKKDAAFLVTTVFSMATVFLTPYGTDMTWIPFVPTTFASIYIQELAPFTLAELTSFHVTKLVFSTESLIAMLLFAACLSVVAFLAKRRPRLSHILLLIGSAILLARGKRFYAEFALLSLPFIRSNPVPFAFNRISNRVNKTVFAVVLAFLMFLPFLYLKSAFSNGPRYPFSIKRLPYGTSKFLSQTDLGGTVFNYPDYGGYLQWILYPRYKIFMDMEVPFLFTNEDMFVAINAWNNEAVLNGVITGYNPDFIIAPMENHILKGAERPFRDIIKRWPHYRIVFFDDSHVLYMRRDHNPRMADRYELKIIDPYRAINQAAKASKEGGNWEPLLEELLGIVGIDGESGAVNQAIAMIYIQTKQYDKAIPYADALIKSYPELATGHRLKADAYRGLERYDDAIGQYEICSKKMGSPVAEKEIGLILFKQGQFKKAYDKLIKVVNIYSPQTTFEDLYHVIYSASMSGRKEDARVLFRYAVQMVPEHNREWVEKYERLGGMIGIEDE